VFYTVDSNVGQKLRNATHKMQYDCQPIVQLIDTHHEPVQFYLAVAKWNLGFSDFEYVVAVSVFL